MRRSRPDSRQFRLRRCICPVGWSFGFQGITLLEGANLNVNLFLFICRQCGFFIGQAAIADLLGDACQSPQAVRPWPHQSAAYWQSLLHCDVHSVSLPPMEPRPGRREGGSAESPQVSGDISQLPESVPLVFFCEGFNGICGGYGNRFRWRCWMYCFEYSTLQVPCTFPGFYALYLAFLIRRSEC
jgi:hypothetical protein